MNKVDNKLTFEYIGDDDWCRKLFRGSDDNLYVNIGGELYTTTPYYEEPNYPIGVKAPLTEEQKNVK